MCATRPDEMRPLIRRLILLTVGVLGLALTAWFSQEVVERSEASLQQRFQLAASVEADAMVSAMVNSLDDLSVLQRFLHSVGELDWTVFKAFADPMINQHMRYLAWAPMVEAAQRIEFETRGQSQWNTDFSIRDVDAESKVRSAASRERYLPILFNLPGESDPGLLGLDILGVEASRGAVERAIEQNEAMAFEATSFESNLESAVDLAVDLASNPAASPVPLRASNDHLLFFALPVYQGGAAPIDRSERSTALRGVLVMALDVGELIDKINRSVSRSGFQVSLFDSNHGSPIAPSRFAERFTRSSSIDVANSLVYSLAYSLDFTLAGRQLRVRIEAAPDWLEANSVPATPYVPAVGILLTLLLLLALYKLQVPGTRADSPAGKHAHDLAQQRALDKLARVFEQSPVSIVITNLDGVIENVNDKFVETTGYAREAVLGQNIRTVRPEIVDNPNYQAVIQALTAGDSWTGELQSWQRDGSSRWERVVVSPIRNRDGLITNHVSTREDVGELHAIMTRLMESEERFRGAVSVMGEGLIIFSAEGRFVFANQAAEAFLGVGASNLVGLAPGAIALERLREDGTLCPLAEYPSTIALREGREIRDAVMGYRSADGSVRWVEINASPLRAIGGAVNGVVLTFSEITARRRTEDQLKLAFEAIRCSGEGILVTDAEQNILSANPAFEAVTGYAADEVIGKTPAIFSSPNHDKQLYSVMYETLESTGYWRGEVWNQRRNGEVYPEWLGVSVVRDDHGQAKYYVYIFSDMTEREAAQQRIEFLAHHDPLTGLPNRLLLRDRVEQSKTLASRTNNQFALMFLDLDRFKTINDSLGHPVGDTLLLEVVDRLKACVRESDTISRQGGDEFIILLNDVRDSDSVARIADKIHQRMGEPFMLGGHALNTSFSIGIALYPEDGGDFDRLLQKADTAMYHAKESGRNAHRFFTEQMNLQVVEHLTLETQLRKAIENKEFVLHYQPQMDLREGTIVGVEALIRWNSPESGLISPARFIPVAEVSGLIVPIGAWVIDEACRQARAWQVAGLQPFTVAVNLSAVQFKRLDLINTVINALVLSELDSQWLELELTESILLQDTESTLDAVRRLKALGVKLSVDDFGTGYSSLAYLKRFSVDKLKIDQSFVRDLLNDPDDAAIVRAIIQMAHSLKLKTIAEGVENEELTNLLRIFNCDEIQGYGFARPMPADQLETFVRQHQAKDMVTTT